MDHDPSRSLFEEIHPPLPEEEALVEADACLQCGGPCAPAPCTAACPAGVDVPGFIHAIAQGRPLDAARIIFDANILGGTCARVCPVEQLCQGSCVLQQRGRRAIQIGRLQRFAADALEEQEAGGARGAARGGERKSRAESRAGARSIGVVGAGPAGLACAAELARLGHKATVYERRGQAGGLVVFGIAPYKQVVDPIPAEVERIRRMGVQFRFGVEVGRDMTPAQLRERHDAVFLGIGMGEDLPAKVPGESLAGVWNSLEFIERLKLDSHLPVIGHRVAVIGGGNTAIDVAREAVRMGAGVVMLVYRRTEAQMPAYRHEIEAAKKEGVRLVCLTAPVEFVGQRRVRGIKCLQMRLGEPDSSGRPRPEPIPGSEFILEADTVVKAIGQRARTEVFEGFGLKTKWGNAEVDRDRRTSETWCFAGGDCTNGGATVVEAVRDGKLAAQAIHRALTGEAGPAPVEIAPARVGQRGSVTVHLQGDFELDTVPTLCKGCSVCVESCPVDTLYLDDKNRIAVHDANKCVFCGLCEARCPDFAIWIRKDGLPPRGAHLESEAMA